MAAALRRSQAIKGSSGFYNVSEKTSPRRTRRGSSVHFDEITSIYPADESNDPHHQLGTLRGDSNNDGDRGAEYEDRMNGTRCLYTCSTLLERPWVGRFFSVISLLNLLSLACSSPWRVCDSAIDGGLDRCEDVFFQFVIITAVDFVISLVYTIQLFMVAQYTIFQCYQDHISKVKYLTTVGNDYSIFW